MKAESLAGKSERGCISTADLLVLTGWESAASLHEFFFFSKQPNQTYLAQALVG